MNDCCCRDDAIPFSLPQDPQPQPANEYAVRALKDFHHHSHLNHCSIPSIELSVLNVGKDLGKGGFAVVKDVEIHGKHYAMKHLRPSICADQFSVAATDLLKEAEFESAFATHPNIVSIHARHVSHENMEENFIIIDRLNETLQQRIETWRAKEACSKRRCATIQQRKKFLCERLRICFDICKTLQYLHSQNVIYRDLKAENLGFDSDGVVKLFDFGLAKELKDDLKSSNGKYKLSGNTGSRAYMAPEVAKCWKYDNKVDVYSFGVLLWEMTALKQAACCLKIDPTHTDLHLPMADWWPVELQNLMTDCCSSFASSRPDFCVVQKELKGIIDILQKEGAAPEPRSMRTFRFLGRRGPIATDKKGTQKKVSPASLPRTRPPLLTRYRKMTI